MPYGGHSVIGLINLLYEVKMPQINDAAYDLSTPAVNSIVTGAQTPTRYFETPIFFPFFAFTIHGEKRKKKYHSLVKELLSYHLLSFLSSGPCCRLYSSEVDETNDQQH